MTRLLTRRRLSAETAAVAGIVLCVACCSTVRLSPLSVKPATDYHLSQSQQGLTISVDPFLEKGRVKEVFGVDLLADGIVPVLVVVENSSTERCFCLRKELATLGGPSEVPHVNQHERPPDKQEQLQGLVRASIVFPAVTVIALPMLISADISITNAQTIRQNIIRRELREKTLGPGESQQGFLYFSLPGGATSGMISTIHLEALNFGSDESMSFSFQIGQR